MRGVAVLGLLACIQLNHEPVALGASPSPREVQVGSVFNRCRTLDPYSTESPERPVQPRCWYRRRRNLVDARLHANLQHLARLWTGENFYSGLLEEVPDEGFLQKVFHWQRATPVGKIASYIKLHPPVPPQTYAFRHGISQILSNCIVVTVQIEGDGSPGQGTDGMWVLEMYLPADRATSEGGGATSEGGGATSEGGGATSEGGGATSERGGATSEGGGATSEGGGATSEGGGATSEGGGATSAGGGATSTMPDLVASLESALSYYGEPSAYAVRSRFGVLLPEAVLQRVDNIPGVDAADSTTSHRGIGLMRLPVLGSLESMINYLYKELVIHKQVRGTRALVALVSISKQLVKIVGNLHRHGMVVGDVTAAKFVVSTEGAVYLDGWDRFRHTWDGSVPSGYAQLLRSPPEICEGRVNVFTAATDTWQLGFLLLQLWCGGFKSPQQSVWDMRDSPTLVSYVRLRAGLATTIDFHSCIKYTFPVIQDMITGFLHPRRRIAPEAVTKVERFKTLEQFI